MKYHRFEDLPVSKDSAELARRMYEFSSSSQFNRPFWLARSVRTCRVVVSNNIAEGFERGSTNELLAFLYIARGSAGEVRSMLKVLDGWSDFSNLKSQISDLINRSEKISKQLYGWIENLKSSEILGQRHLDENARIRYLTKQRRQDFLEELDRINLSEAEKRQTARKPT
jgi:four helix bundle protein